MSVQVIEKNGVPEYAVIPYKEYQRLVEQAEEAQDRLRGKLLQLAASCITVFNTPQVFSIPESVRVGWQRNIRPVLPS